MTETREKETPGRASADSAVAAWIAHADGAIPRRWKNIGKEVYSRKSLLFAASEDLKSHNIENEVALAATDVFVEKAQKLLTTRARWCMTWGFLMSTVTLAMLISASFWLYEHDIVTGIAKYGALDGLLFTLLVVKATTAGAIFAAAIYFAMSLSKAFLHEGIVLYSRRHALRFGRLYVYLSKGRIKFKELEEAFKWNAEFTSAFKDINPEKASGHPAPGMIHETANLLDKAGALVATATGKPRQKKDDGGVQQPPAN
jgi:hypothetical protein